MRVLFCKKDMTKYVSLFIYSSSIFTVLQYKGGMFKVSVLDRWLVVITGTRMIEELIRMPEEIASFNEAAAIVSFCEFPM